MQKKTSLKQSSTDFSNDSDSKFCGIKLRHPRFVYMISIITAVGGFLFGYDTGVIGGALLYISDEFHLSPADQELVVSMAIVGNF